MSLRTVKYKPNNYIEPCPKCGNNTEFTIRSEQCAEDLCEIWAVCKCNYNPTAYEEYGDKYRVEDVWGGTDDGNCRDAIDFSWNEPLQTGIKK